MSMESPIRVAPIPGLPNGILAQVRPHLKETTGFILASSGDCLALQRREVDTIKNRIIRPVRTHELDALRPPSSWLLGALLCPNEDTSALATWALRLPDLDQARIRFYVHEGTDVGNAMNGWIRADLRPIQFVEIGSWEQFHQRFGADHAIRVYQAHVHGRSR